jgi:hypothetical protein
MCPEEINQAVKEEGKMRKMMKVTVACALVGLVGLAWAKTPDGQTPAEERVCDGLTGAAFGLCNAYCEAQDCDVHSRPSCEQLRRNFARVTGTRLFPCDAFCGNGRLDPGEECELGDICRNGLPCQDDCTCPRCPLRDKIIDADGTLSRAEGIPDHVEVRCGDRIIALVSAVNWAGLDHFDNDGDFAWTFGPAGDDLHLEDPFAGTCPTAIRDADHDLGLDCIVLDLDGSLFDQQPVSCDNPCDPAMSFFDANGNGFYDDGEDIILDANVNGVFD